MKKQPNGGASNTRARKPHAKHTYSHTVASEERRARARTGELASNNSADKI